MALTQSELTSIVNQVLSAIRTNSKTIDQLTPVQTLGASDYFEVSDGKRVAYTVLRDLIASLSTTEQDSLRTLINKNVLKSVEFAATESAATLTIKTVGVTISASIPVATSSRAGIMTAADKVKLQSAYENAATAKDTANTAKTTAQNALNTAQTLENSKGQPNGLAPLDPQMKIPSRYIPDAYDDVKEFGAQVSGVTTQMSSSSHLSTDDNCMVVYDTDNNVFLLAVAKTPISDTDWRCVDKKTLLVEIQPHIVAGDKTTLKKADLWKINESMQVQLVTGHFTYYNNWVDGDLFGTGTPKGRVPVADKQYVDTSANCNYRWSGTQLVSTGSDLALGHTANTAFPGDEGQILREDFDEFHDSKGGPGGLAPLDFTRKVPMENIPDTALMVVPFHGEIKGAIIQTVSTSLSSSDDFCSVVFDTRTQCFLLRVIGKNGSGVASTKYFNNWIDADRWGRGSVNGREPYVDRIYISENEAYIWKGTKLDKLGGSATGNCYNVTNEKPLPAGEYYNLETAIAATLESGVAALGLQISFAIQAGSWKTYQFVGVNITEPQFKALVNWIDLAGMSAGDEPIINVNKLCGGLVYNLSTAIVAVRQKEQATGLSYFKPGIILTYKRDDAVWETKQYLGEISDISETDTSQWVDFGGAGGSNLEASDTPEEGGGDAFSTGGAYDMEQKMIVDFDQTEDAENILVQGVNKKGQPVGSQLKIPKGGGGGGSASGSSLSIFLRDQAIYAAYGSRITSDIAVKSVSYDGDEEILGVVRSLEIVDATTGLTLWSDDVNQKSSTSATDYKFTLDFTDYFTAAARRDFTIVARDAEGNVKRRTITVTAVDVTCTCVQTLNYTTASALEVGGSTKNLLMYKFASNVSKDGVQVKTEMFYGGEWRTLGTAAIKDSYSHSISIDPKNVFGGGEALEHGSYPIRIQGVDVASGVKGNVVYTAVMCVDPSNHTPIVSMRYNDANNGKLRLYDSLEVEVAAYTPGQNSTIADIYIDGHIIKSEECQISLTYKVRKQIQGYATDGSEKLTVHAESGPSKTNNITIIIEGSAIAAVLKEGALFGYDFATRSNSESDHSISDNGFTMEVYGSNWSSNGFGTYLGENCLKIAENVTALIPWAPFGNASVERTNGVAVQMAFATKNIKDDEAKLIECYDESSGAGFYVCGNKVVLYCKNGSPAVCTRPFRCGEKITMAVVVEPSTKTVIRGTTEYSTIKLYINGEEVAAIGYIANSGAILNASQIKFNGTEGDLHLYYFLAYDSYYEWAQAFQNYLCKLTDTAAMIAEYDAENVLDNQNKPSLDLLKAKGIPYYVVVAPQATFDSFDSDIDTSAKFTCTLFYFHPTMPWRSFKATNVQWRRQGTTSAKRPIKNDRFYLKKPVNKADKIVVTPVYPDYTNEDALMSYKLMSKNAVRVGESTIPVSIITVKVDYSDSSNANDCGVCDMMNATFRALGSDYMTPAQRAFDGTWQTGDLTVTGLQMNHSTANHPIAAFRSTMESISDAWFHAKGNWKEDKGEQIALGFQKTPGYNKGCLNYGDFIEFFGTKGETLDQTMARFKATEGLDTSKPYILSQYCGRDYRVMRFSGGEWARSTGSMKQVNGKWVITGDVLNPVSGYELITYDGMDWWMGVSSIEDMMAPVTKQSSWVTKLKLGQATYPAWTQFFECMIDDDQLQEDLAMGRKVPYDLYNVLKFCDSCDYSKEDLHPTWNTLWRLNAWKYMSIQSLISYYTFTDYLAAVDQQAKNMQPMFFLEDGCSVENGVYKSSGGGMEPVRMYFNKVYDCDTCNGKDNDGGNTIPATLDPANDDKCYAGRGSILWNDLRRCSNQEMVIDGNGKTLTLPGVVATMRNLPEIEGIGAGPFSPQGAYLFFLTKRMLTWPKLVSSFDGERKYINYTGYNDLYYYALHGLGLTSLPRFIEQRWRVRDGYYQTGDFKDASHVLGGRVGAKTGAKIYFTAAKDGYFGIGNDGGNVTQGMYLKAGENGVFTEFQHGDNILLYIYQADQMSEIDLSEISIDPNFQFSVMTLAEKIVIGSASHKGTWRLSPGNTGFLTNMNLGELPFLRELDVTGTEVTTINAAKCPRLEKVRASDSDLATISLAETAPIDQLVLPASITELSLVNLPKLTYPGGLELAGLSNVQRVMLSGCPNIDPMGLINEIIKSSSIRYIRLPDVNITAPSSVLNSLKASGAIGLDPTGSAYEESGKCSGVTGRWIMADLIEDSDLNALKAYFPALEIHNSQYSCICFSDIEQDTANVSNMDNETGYKFNNPFVPSGHFVKLEAMSKAYKCSFNARDGKMHLRRLGDPDYNFMADGSDIDLADNSGEGFDIMKDVTFKWYKGVNNFKHQEKYLFESACDGEPISTANKIIRKRLADILVKATSAVFMDDVIVGAPHQLSDNPNMSVYAIEVDGMKQVRWPGVNSALVGAVFLDEDGNVISKYAMSVGTSTFDFVLGDYIYIDVPAGAKMFVFTAPIGFDDQEAIAVDSSDIEAVEPDWVCIGDPNNPNYRVLCGVYGMTLDGLGRARSISGGVTKRGGDASQINGEWTYDENGDLTNTSIPISTMYGSAANLINLCRMRGKGYFSIDYEMSKDIANLVMGLVGDRDIQAICGYGCGAGYTTGSNGFNALGNVTRKWNGSNNGNIILGIQNFIGCNSEWMDNVAVNVPTFVDMRVARYAENASFPVNHKWHIYNPRTKTERVVQGITNEGGDCILRVKFGRYADVIASRCSSDCSKYNTGYGDGQWYSQGRSRVPLRSGYGAVANGGLVFTSASNAGTYSSTFCGVRLAFRGECVFDDEEA